MNKEDLRALAQDIKTWGREIGFQEIGIADTDLTNEAVWLNKWIDAGHHGDMDYMVRGAALRADPAANVPGTISVITARLNYESPDARDSWGVVHDAGSAFVSRYALGRDYHKVLRTRLQALADRIATAVAASHEFRYRVFTDSAPVMEVALATKAGIGWRGKHTLLLNREAGSMFFLGEIYVNLDLPKDAATTEHCGSCTKCISICPTQAIVAPYQLDARRCISYLTIENKGPIPRAFREAMGNRIYGCDDCQLVCPWNKYAVRTVEKDFAIRHGLDNISLLDLWRWTETEWLVRMEGSAIRRIGFERWQRNLAVASGNALRSDLDAATKHALSAQLQHARQHATPLVAEHLDWALAQPS